MVLERERYPKDRKKLQKQLPVEQAPREQPADKIARKESIKAIFARLEYERIYQFDIVRSLILVFYAFITLILVSVIITAILIWMGYD
jgi:hypothetical protein